MSPRITSTAWIILFALAAFAAVAIAQPDKEGPDKGDKQFVHDAAEASMAEVKIGQLAMGKAASEDVKHFAQRMIDDHTLANNELKALAGKKMIDMPKDIGKHEKTHDKLAKYNAAEFDKEYIDAMVKDHKEVVEMFEKQTARGQDSDIKKWAAQTLPTLQAHLKHAEEMQKMMKEKKGH